MCFDHGYDDELGNAVLIACSIMQCPKGTLLAMLADIPRIETQIRVSRPPIEHRVFFFRHYYAADRVFFLRYIRKQSFSL